MFVSECFIPRDDKQEISSDRALRMTQGPAPCDKSDISISIPHSSSSFLKSPASPDVASDQKRRRADREICNRAALSVEGAHSVIARDF